MSHFKIFSSQALLKIKRTAIVLNVGVCAHSEKSLHGLHVVLHCSQVERPYH